MSHGSRSYKNYGLRASRHQMETPEKSRLYFVEFLQKYCFHFAKTPTSPLFICAICFSTLQIQKMWEVPQSISFRRKPKVNNSAGSCEQTALK